MTAGGTTSPPTPRPAPLKSRSPPQKTHIRRCGSPPTTRLIPDTPPPTQQCLCCLLSIKPQTLTRNLMKLRCHLPCLSGFLIAQLAFPKEHLKHLEHLKTSRSFSSGLLLTSGEVLVDGREGPTPAAAHRGRGGWPSCDSSPAALQCWELQILI